MDLNLFARRGYRPFPGNESKGEGEIRILPNPDLEREEHTAAVINDMVQKGHLSLPKNILAEINERATRERWYQAVHERAAAARKGAGVTGEQACPTVAEMPSFAMKGVGVTTEQACSNVPEMPSPAMNMTATTTEQGYHSVPENDNVRQVQRLKSPLPTEEKKSNNAISYDKIKITSPWEIQSLEELSIGKTLNNHAELRISIIIDESTAAKAGLQETMDDPIKVYSDDEGNKTWLFQGRLKDVAVSFKAGVYKLTAWFLSETIILDREEKSRSFQNTNLTYNDIVQQVLSEYPGKRFEFTAPKVRIDGPIIQYKETDWQFIKRLASYQETVIVPDIAMNDQIFSYGYPSGCDKELPDTTTYSCGKNMAAYYIDHEYNPNLHDNEYTYFEVESYDALTFGGEVTFFNIPFYVGEVSINLIKGILVYTTKLVRKTVLRQNPIYNEKIQGISLQGKILALQNQEIKLHLAIDEEQAEDTAYWYPFAPPTVDMLYLMPQIGTTASLYMPSEKEQEAIIIGCVRANGASCKQTSDPNTRYLATEYGQELKLAPGGIYLTAGNEELILDFDDAEGVKISSHKGMVIEAKEELIFASQKKVFIESPNQIIMTTPLGGISMENEIHFDGMKTIIECTDEAELPMVKQPKPEPPEPSYILRRPQIEVRPGIDWGSIINAGLGIRVAEASSINSNAGSANYMPGQNVQATGSSSAYAEMIKRREWSRGLELVNSTTGTIAIVGYMGTENIQNAKAKGILNYINAYVHFCLNHFFGAFTGAKLSRVDEKEIIEANKRNIIDNFNDSFDDPYRVNAFIRSMQKIYNDFMKLPKVDGDTKQKLITDFGKQQKQLTEDQMKKINTPVPTRKAK